MVISVLKVSAIQWSKQGSKMDAFVLHGNTKKALNMIPFDDRKHDGIESSVKFHCQSNSKNFNTVNSEA